MSQSKIKIASLAAVTTFGLIAGVARAGGLHIDINVGVPAPVVRADVHTDVVVLDFDHYCVGFHRNLYDADWRLRNAQIEQWHAQEALDIARSRMGEVSVNAEGLEAFVADYDKRIAESDAALAAGPRLIDARAHLAHFSEEMAAAHDALFAAQQRLDAAIGNVALALHDRDEALWMLHRDEILTGRCEFASCGFTIDLGVWGGRMPRDPEVVHAYFVHPVTYWVERPVEIQARMIEVDRVAEISRVRTIQEKHEGPKFHEVVKFEAAVPIEARRQYAQRVVVERERLTAERTERASAAAEHRAPRIPDTEKAEARAIVTKARAEAKATNIEAKAEVNKAKADAKSERIESKAAANAEETKARADAKSEKIESRADAKADKKPAADPKHDSRQEPAASAKTPAKNSGSARTDDKNKDPRNKPKDGTAYTDPNR